MSVDRNVIITTGEEVVTPQKAERIRQEIEHNRKRGEAYEAMLPSSWPICEPLDIKQQTRL